MQYDAFQDFSQTRVIFTLLPWMMKQSLLICRFLVLFLRLRWFLMFTLYDYIINVNVPLIIKLAKHTNKSAATIKIITGVITFSHPLKKSPQTSFEKKYLILAQNFFISNYIFYGQLNKLNLIHIYMLLSQMEYFDRHFPF